SGPGSLRQAILDSNARPGPDIIAFDLPPFLDRVDLGSGFGNAGRLLDLNGNAAIWNNALRLSGGSQGGQSSSAFTSDRVAVDPFSTHFQFQAAYPESNGFTFTIQGMAPTALGGGGYSDDDGLGYGSSSSSGKSGIPGSIAVKFDFSTFLYYPNWWSYSYAG